MPITYPLPPDTRAVGTGNPPADMNQVVDALNHSVYQKVFYLDRYGADPTGVAVSDTAWTNCYADAVAAVQSSVANSGSVIVLGAGVYKFSVNTVKISDARIGFRGQGRWATTITTTGNTGDLLYFTDNTLTSAQSAPIGGFTVWGWQAGNSVNGIRFGNRSMTSMTDVKVYGFNANAASRGYWFIDDALNNLSEHCFFQLDADQNSINYDFDGSGGGGGGITSFDYSHMFLHANGLTNNSSITMMRFINGQHSVGSFIQLTGNIASNNASFTGTVLQIGNSGTDTAHITGCTIQLAVECDNAVGTVKDMVVQGASGAGLIKCGGQFFFINVGGTFTAGSVTSPAIVTCWGNCNGPLFSSHGTLTTLGSAAAALSTYSG